MRLVATIIMVVVVVAAAAEVVVVVASGRRSCGDSDQLRGRKKQIKTVSIKFASVLVLSNVCDA